MSEAPSIPSWQLENGEPVACREKLRVLEENHAELAQMMQDAFEDAILMGVGAESFRDAMHALAAGLRDPRAGRRDHRERQAG